MKKRLLSLVMAIAMIGSLSILLPNSNLKASAYYGGNNNTRYNSDVMYNCVDYVKTRFYECFGFQLHPTGSNYANGYYHNAAYYGDTILSNPVAGCLAVWGDSNPHVGFVEEVNNNQVYISEGNVNSKYREDWYNLNDIRSGYRWSNYYQPFLGFVLIKGSTPQQSAPKGCLDSVNGGTGEISVSGWAFDPDVPNESISVHVYIGGPAGSNNVECVPVTANQKRDDVNAAYGISGNHGFSATIPTSKTGNQSIHIYAINNNSGANNPEIMESGKTVYITEAHKHNYSSVVESSATCTEAGISTYTCACGDSYSKPIPKLGHNYSTRIVQPTITEKGYNLHTCTRCGDSYKDNYVDAPSLKDDGWYYCSKLPSGVTASDYEIQYKNNYEKIQENSPGADWKNAGTAQDEWVNTGNAYRSLTELSTSDSRILTGWNFFHFCGSNAGVYANYEQSGNYVHCDEVDPGRVWVASEGWDSDGNIPYYILNWNGGSDRVYCESGTTCDGSYGTHGQRAYTWYKQFWYQDRNHIVKYKFTKTSGWTSSADSSANSTEIRFRAKHDHSYTSKITKAATCKEAGVKTFTCLCGDSYTESIPKLTTHTFGNWTTTKEG